MKTSKYIFLFLFYFGTLFAQGNLLYVVNNAGNNISIVNVAKNHTVQYVNNDSITLTRPSDIQFLPDGSKGFVVFTNGVAVLHPTSNHLVGLVDDSLGPFNVPVQMVITSDGSKAYVLNHGNSTVSILDTATNTVSGIVNAVAPFFLPESIAITPDSTKVYVTNVNNTVNIIDVATDTTSQYVTTTATVSFDLPFVNSFVNNSTAYVSNLGDGTVTVIDVATDTCTSYINFLSGSFNRVLDLATYSLLANLTTYAVDKGANAIYLLENLTSTVVGSLFDSGHTLNQPTHVSINPLQTTAYVTNFAGNTLSIVNIVLASVTGTISGGPAPFNGPYRSAFLP